MRLLLVMRGGEAHSCSTGVVVVAQIDLHVCGLLLDLGLVHVSGSGQDVDLLVEARVIVEMLIEASVSALAALI